MRLSVALHVLVVDGRSEVHLYNSQLSAHLQSQYTCCSIPSTGLTSNICTPHSLSTHSSTRISTANMDLSESQATFPSDSEIYDANYDANHSNSQDSEEQTSDSSSPLILYSPPTFLSIARGAAINLLLPFINGLMLGFGELFAHEAAFRLGWGGTRVRHILLCGGMRCWDRSDGKSAERDMMSNWLTTRTDLPQPPKLKDDGTWRGDQGGPG